MRADLPQCDLKNCRLCFDGNCKSKREYERCQYQQLRSKSLKIELVSSSEGNWYGVYMNGVLAYEGHDVPPDKLVSAFNQFLPLDYTVTSVPQETLEAGLPSFKEYPF